MILFSILARPGMWNREADLRGYEHQHTFHARLRISLEEGGPYHDMVGKAAVDCENPHAD